MRGYVFAIATGLLAASLPVQAQSGVTAPVGRANAPRVASPSAARSVPAPRPAAAGRALDPRVLPGTNQSAFTTIKGNALDSSGASMPQATVRLRDARSGQIVDTQLTDNSGLFTFESIDPGSYIVEIVGETARGTGVVAASQLLNVNAGDVMSAIVKLPFRIPPFAGILGHTTTSATLVAASAASAGVLAVTANECASPPCGGGRGGQ